MARRNTPANNKVVLANACKTLLANIQFASIDRPVRTVVVTSTTPNEGKSTTAMSLAVAAASSGRKVLLLEGDMRNRSLASFLGINAGHGLYSVLTHAVTLGEAVVPTKHRNLSFLDVEPNIPNPADVIGSKRFADLIEEMRLAFDLVVIDTPPVGAVVDAAMLGALCDGVLFVLRDNYTKRTAAVEAVSQLRLAGANILGTVLNDCDQPGGSSYDSYYYSGPEGASSELAPQDLRAASHTARTARRAGSRFKQ